MPFLAPAIPALISGGAGILGGILGGGQPGLSGAGQQAQNNLLGYGTQGINSINNLMGQLAQWAPYTNFGNTSSWYPYVNTFLDQAQKSGDTGADLLNSAKGTLGNATNYWTSVLSGGPQAFQALSPTIQQSNANYQQAKNSISNFAPMGGGRASTLSQLPLQQAGAIGNIFASAQPTAATNLGQLGGTYGQLGTSLSNASTGLAGNLAGTLSNLTSNLSGDILRSWLGIGQIGQGANSSILGTDVQRTQQGAQNGALLGGGLFNIARSIPWGSMGGGRGGGFSTAGTYTPGTFDTP